jgi:hypothetical protein
MSEQAVCRACGVAITEWDGVWYGPPDGDDVCDPTCDRSDTVLHEPVPAVPAQIERDAMAEQVATQAEEEAAEPVEKDGE